MTAGHGFAPSEGLDVHETEDGLIIFNPATDRVHHLNHTAGTVFVLCDGSRDGGAIAREMAAMFALDAPPVQEVERALAELVGEGVLVAKPLAGS
jgi:hypothetical protein